METNPQAVNLVFPPKRYTRVINKTFYVQVPSYNRQGHHTSWISNDGNRSVILTREFLRADGKESN